jgi:hypothetical protein
MHARIEQLLSLRDGEPVSAPLQAHVAGCAHCTGLLADLSELRQRLASLPEPTPGLPDWTALRDRMVKQQAVDRRRAWVATAGLAASVAALAVATLWRLQEPVMHAQFTDAGRVDVSAQDVEQALAADRLLQLRSQSQALEELLARLPRQPAIERAGTALPIDTIEAQVQWLDHQLLLSGEGMQPDAAENLWRERVAAMNSLVQLRYVDAQRVAM